MDYLNTDITTDYLNSSEFHEDRMLAYRFLAFMYKTAPNAAFIDSLLAMDSQTKTPLDSCIETMKSLDPEQLRIDLAAEYNRVFLSMGPDPVAPYESVYTSPHRLLMQEARDEVLALYRAEALKPSDETRIPEDHISIEFEYMAYLCGEAAQAFTDKNPERAEDYINKQKAFLQEHLLIWVLKMCDDMEKRVHTEFYKSLCAMTKEQLESDRDWLSEV